MFFIDDDQSQGADCRKDGRTGADTDMALPICHTQPVIPPFPFRQLTVHDNDIIAKAADKPAYNLPGQGDFRNEDQYLFPFLEYIFCQLHIHFRLATARDAVKDIGASVPVVPHRINSPLLFFRKRKRNISFERMCQVPGLTQLFFHHSTSTLAQVQQNIPRIPLADPV